MPYSMTWKSMLTITSYDICKVKVKSMLTLRSDIFNGMKETRRENNIFTFVLDIHY